MRAQGAFTRSTIAVGISACLGAAAFGGGLIALLGWILDLPRLTDWYGNGISMQANAAAATMCAGLALVLRPLGLNRAAIILSVVVALIGGATLWEHAANINLGIDTLIVERSWGSGATVSPGRMGPPASMSFLLLGLGLILASGGLGGWCRVVAPWPGVGTSVIALVAIIGYLYGASQLFTMAHLTGIAFQTAAIILVLAMGLVWSVPEHQPARILLEDSGAGLLARRALPFVILLPLVLGWIRVWGQEGGLYDTGMGTALLVVALIVLISTILGWSAAIVGSRERALAAIQVVGQHAQDAVREREHQLQFMADLAPVRLARCDAVGKYRFVNASYAKALGLQPEQIIGKHISEVLGESTYTHIQQHVAFVLSGNHTEFEMELAGNDDHSRQVLHVAYEPERGPSGGILGFVAAIIDISERKRLERQLQQRLSELTEAEERMRSVVDHVIDGIITIDVEGTIKSFNPSAEKLFDFKASEVIGKNVKMLMPEPYQGEHDSYIANYIRTSEAKVIGIGREVIGRRKNGSTFPMDLAVSTFFLEHVQYFTGIVRDVTERKELERELRQRVDELREADLRKDEFLATLAHELRNPLAPVRNSLEIMKRADGDAGLLEKACATMDRQVSQMERLIDDLMDVSRITRDKLDLRKERVELAPIIQHAIEACRPLADSANHELIVRLPTEPIHLNADAARLAQVFGNLLINACKYTKRGGRICLTGERHGGDVIISVKDNGIGIAPDMLPHVFALFTQIDQTLERSQGGLGIGLTLVKRLVALHNGTVTAHSDGEGQGSEFILHLPILIETPALEQAPLPVADFKSTRAHRILVVDDNRDAAISLAMLLKLTGHETLTAHDGVEAVAKAESFQADVILLDIGLPKLNGYDACRAIREQPWGREILIVALTGWGQDEDRRRSKEAGFDGHLVKPVDQSALMNLLASESMGEAGQRVET